jgi:hypothetical protein
MSNNKVKLYIGSNTSMFVNVVSCVACLSIMCCTTSGVKMHVLLVFCGCSIIVLYFWNQGLVCIFCQNIILVEVFISSTVKVQSTMPSQLKRGLFKRILSIICHVVNP